MEQSYSKQIQDRIKNSADGTIFINSDFTDIADTETVRRNLNRLVKAKVIRRILKGIFEKPIYSQLLNEYVAVDPDKVAQSIARTYRWTIAPSGNTALNLLGLSTQVSSVWSYVSDGPYRTYQWGSTKIEFLHRTNRDITGLSYMTVLVLQSLKTIGKENINTDIIKTISRRLTKQDKENCLREAAQSTDWIYNIIRLICREE